jgi:hypothetical protein
MGTTRIGTISGPVALVKVAGRDGDNRNLTLCRVPTISVFGVSIVPTIRVVRRFESMARKLNSGCEPGGPRMAPNYFDSMNRLAGELLGTRPGLGRRNTVRSRDARMVGCWNEG